MSASFTKNFMLCTNESEATAQAFLSHTDGVLENALLLYYETNGQTSKLVLPPRSCSPSPPKTCSFAFASVSHTQSSTTVRISTPPTPPAIVMPTSPPARPFSSPRQTFSSIPPIRLPPPHAIPAISARSFENKTLSPTMPTNELNEFCQDCQELENRNQCTLMNLYEANDIVSVQLDMIETLRYKLKMATNKNIMLIKKTVVR